MDLYETTKRDAAIALAHFLNNPADETRDAAQASVEAHLRVCKDHGRTRRRVLSHSIRTH